MMIKVLFVMSVFVSGAAHAGLSWNPGIIKKVDARYAGSLKLVRKDLVQVITKKITTSIERTKNPTQFLVNKKPIDLRNFSNSKELTIVLKKIIPRADLSAALWISSAIADEVPEDVVQIIQATLTATAQSEACENFRDFANACTQMAQYMSNSYIAEMEKEMANPSSDEVFYKKLTDWHAHMTVLKTNIDQKAVPLLGSGSEQIGKCGCEVAGKCGDPKHDVPLQMKICTDAVNNIVDSTQQEGADLKASVQKIKELVKSIYTNSVPMDGTSESPAEVGK